MKNMKKLLLTLGMTIFVASCSGDNKKTENAEVQTQQQEVEKSNNDSTNTVTTTEAPTKKEKATSSK